MTFGPHLDMAETWCSQALGKATQVRSSQGSHVWTTSKRGPNVTHTNITKLIQSSPSTTNFTPSMVHHHEIKAHQVKHTSDVWATPRREVEQGNALPEIRLWNVVSASQLWRGKEVQSLYYRAELPKRVSNRDEKTLEILKKEDR
ncbi:hypothetical protein PIB30_071267 [Stylosanthes scabra]|uniref:Uncharacterized protein n=1 Tax=Stylosanthes scabra TaxID=79078 RepID=A0ABU6TP84_9FABA|nr:hypothetical protein [Stylosanthes scabra]